MDKIGKGKVKREIKGREKEMEREKDKKRIKGRKKEKNCNSPKGVAERGVTVTRARALSLFLALTKPLGLTFFRPVIPFNYLKKKGDIS